MSLTPSLLHPVKGPLDRALGGSQYRSERGTKRNSKHGHLARSQTRVGLSYVMDHEENTCSESSHYGIVDGDKFTYYLFIKRCCQQLVRDEQPKKAWGRT
jgi:hypothetical protein